MPRRRWRDSVKSFFSGYLDNENEEELEGKKQEADNKLQKIFALLKREDNEVKEPLVDLIEDFNNNYQSLYARHFQLTEELRKKAKSKHDKGSSSSSSDSSDSDDSSKKRIRNNGDVEKKIEGEADVFKQERENALLEVEELKRNLKMVRDEKEDLSVEYQNVLIQTQEAHKIIADLNNEKSNLLTEKADLSVEMEKVQNLVAELKHNLEEMNSSREILVAEKDNLHLELEAAKEDNKSLSSNISKLENDIKEATDKIQCVLTESSQLGEKWNDEKSVLLTEKTSINTELESSKKLLDELNQKLDSFIISIEEEKRNGENLRTLNLNLQQDKETEQLKLEELKGEFSGLKEKLELAESEITKLNQVHGLAEEKNSTFSAKILELENELKNAEDKIQGFINDSNDLNERLVVKEKELFSHQEIHETHKEETSTRIKCLEEELDSTNSQRTEMEKLKNDELDALNKKLKDQENESVNKVNDFTMQISNIQGEVESLKIHKRDLEEQVLREGNEASVQIKELTDRVNAGKIELESLLSLKLESENQLERRIEEGLDYLNQIENLKQELAGKLLEVKTTIEEKETLALQLEHLDREHNSTRNLKTELEEQLTVKSRETSESLTQIETFKEEIMNRTQEHQKILEEKENLTGKVGELNLELNELKSQKHDLEEQLKSSCSDLSRLREETENLQAKGSELEKAYIEKETELSILQKKYEDRDNEASAQISAFTADINTLQQELTSLNDQKNDRDIILEKKSGEISEFQIQIDKLKEELSSKTDDGLRLVEEKVNLEGQLKNLKLELETLHREKNELEDEIRRITDERNELKEEKGGLEGKIDELEKDASTQIAVLTGQLNSLNHDLELLQSEKKELELQIERGKQELTDRLAHAESHKTELSEKIKVHERNLNEKEVSFIQFREDHGKLELNLHRCEENLRSSEKKIKEMTEQFEEEIATKNNEITQLEEKVEDLKRDLEMKADELDTLIENVRNIEVKQRLTSQKLRITEQLLTEKEQSHLNKEQKLKEEQKSLEEKVETLLGMISVYKENQAKMVSSVSEKVNETLTRIDAFGVKFEEDYGHSESRIYEITNELKVTRNWIKGNNNEKDRLSNEVACLVQDLKNGKEKELIMEEKIKKLEMGSLRDQEQSQCLIQTMKLRDGKLVELERIISEKNEMINEKDHGFSSLIEEKIEAIKQLCILIDYHRNRYDDLKDMITKTRVGRRQITTT